MTARTTAYLKATTFALAGAPARIGPQSHQDHVDSVQLWDAPAGLATPNLIRGTYNGRAEFERNGGVAGDMSGTPGQRATNGTALNAVMSAAVSAGKFVALEPGLYEINNAGGIVVPQAVGGWAFRGSKRGTIISQFATNAPILSLGDLSTSSTSAGWEIRGFGLTYGVTQAGQTAAVALQIGMCEHGIVGDFWIAGSFAPYDAVTMTAPGTLFSMRFPDWEIWKFQRDGIRMSFTGTGNHWDNTYITAGGYLAPAAITGSCVNLALLNRDEQTFTRLNCEWVSGNAAPAIAFAQQRGCVFNALHLEGIQLTGADATAFYAYDTSAIINGLTLVDLITTGSTGTASLFTLDYNGGIGSTVRVIGFNWTNNQTTQLSTNVRMLKVTATTDVGTKFSIDGGKVNFFTSFSQDIRSHAQFDDHMPLSAGFIFPEAWGLYVWGSGGSRVEDATITVSATYTHRGQHEGATLNVPSVITSFTLTLSDVQGATGTQKVKTGTVTRVRRLSTTTGSGTLTIRDAAAATLGTPGTTAGVDFWHQFTGTQYVVFTPVT